MNNHTYIATWSNEDFFIFLLYNTWIASIETGFENIFEKSFTDLFYRRRKLSTLLRTHGK